MRRTALLLVIGMLGLGACVAACGAAGVPGSGRCLPSALHVAPRQVRSGGTVMLSSAPFACAARYPGGKTYTVVLGLAGRGTPVQVADVPVRRDGSFRATVRIPASASPGQASLIVRGSAFDKPCRDTSTGSCAGYMVDLTILPASSTRPGAAPSRT